MQAITFLSDAEFGIADGQRGRILCTKLENISVVLFYSKMCPHCTNVFPVFTRLASRIRVIKFAVLNCTQYPRVVEMSQSTISQIDSVPMILLYVNGKPYIRYKGAHTEAEIGKFLVGIYQRLQKTEVTKVEEEEENFLCNKGDGICYFKLTDKVVV